MSADVPDFGSVQLWFSTLEKVSADFEKAKMAGTPDDVSDAARGWYTVAAQVLAAYCLKTNWPGGYGGVPIQHLPHRFVEKLRTQFLYLAAGQIPGPMLMVRKKGKEPGPDESQDIGVAISYIHAARAGIIADGNPIKTICDAYGANKRTVQRWRAERDWVTPDMFFPELSGPELAESVTVAMQRAGAAYKAAGRTQAAIAGRASQRRRV